MFWPLIRSPRPWPDSKLTLIQNLQDCQRRCVDDSMDLVQSRRAEERLHGRGVERSRKQFTFQ